MDIVKTPKLEILQKMGEQNQLFLMSEQLRLANNKIQVVEQKQQQLITANQALVNLVGDLVKVVEKLSPPVQQSSLTSSSSSQSSMKVSDSLSMSTSSEASSSRSTSITTAFNATLDVTRQPRGPGERDKVYTIPSSSSSEASLPKVWSSPTSSPRSSLSSTSSVRILPAYDRKRIREKCEISRMATFIEQRANFYNKSKPYLSPGCWPYLSPSSSSQNVLYTTCGPGRSRGNTHLCTRGDLQ